MSGVNQLIQRFEQQGHLTQGNWGQPLWKLYKEGQARKVRVTGRATQVEVSENVMDQHDPVFFALLNGAVASSQHRLVLQSRIRALLTALRAAQTGGAYEPKRVLEDVVLPSGKRFPGQMTFGQFAELTAAEQMDVINFVWNRNVMCGDYNRTLAQMTEPNVTVMPPGSGLPLPSSVHPIDNNANVRRLQLGTPGTPFKTLGVAFRVDGRKDADIDRIKTQGMTAQVANMEFMHEVKGWELDGTQIAGDTRRPRLWTENRDLLNESGVCVARTLLGATAFPERCTGAPAKGGPTLVNLFAVNCTGLLGYDTEQFQIDNNALWRPGEKAFERIPKEQVIAYIKLKRTGGEAGANWKFQIDPGTRWIPVNRASDEVQRYIDAELAAWATGVEWVIHGPTFDFVYTA